MGDIAVDYRGDGGNESVGKGCGHDHGDLAEDNRNLISQLQNTKSPPVVQNFVPSHCTHAAGEMDFAVSIPSAVVQMRGLSDKMKGVDILC